MYLSWVHLMRQLFTISMKENLINDEWYIFSRFPDSKTMLGQRWHIMVVRLAYDCRGGSRTSIAGALVTNEAEGFF